MLRAQIVVIGSPAGDRGRLVMAVSQTESQGARKHARQRRAVAGRVVLALARRPSELYRPGKTSGLRDHGRRLAVVRDRPPQRGLVAGTEKRDLRPGRSGGDPSPLPLPIGLKADVGAARLSFQPRAFGSA